MENEAAHKSKTNMLMSGVIGCTYMFVEALFTSLTAMGPAVDSQVEDAELITFPSKMDQHLCCENLTV